ncbi:hypothetical protein IEO70_03510 [Bacillus sp. AGMB 02131]|uniref:DUF3899 domain-containing protein n=1 Tax=Peribacillus faecalis TaxID=2772559 RepID=A0A927HAD1_9BACI|nr:hypothetical protein [Peribacillus faecalis]MBD3107422.1 hypothetical protein [Peribacillus faecalis]
MKQFLTILATLVFLIALNFGISSVTDTHFVDFSFVVGLTVSVLIWYFTSKGGYTAKHADTLAQAETMNWKIKNEKFSFRFNTAFLTAIAYTVVAIGITFYYYKDYFLT